MRIGMLWLIWGCALLLKCYFALCETALFASDQLELTRRSQNGDRGAHRGLELLKEPKSLLSGLLLGTNLSMVVATITAGNLSLAYKPFGAHSEAFTTVLMIVLVLFATELIPKAYAARAPERITAALASSLMLLLILLRPLAKPFDLLAERVVAITGRPAYQERQGDEAIITLAEISSEAGQITTDTEEMIAAVLTNDDRTVREVMRPRVDIMAFAKDVPWNEAIERIAAYGYSRWPVYDESIDHIIGLVYRRDILVHFGQDKPLPPLVSVLREPLYVPESKLISDLIAEMRSLRCHMAIVLDEYGSTAGLVTLEDLLEEVFGEIQDETDPMQEAALRPVPQGALVDAALPLAELAEHFDLPQDLPLELYDTVAGFLLGELGRLPKEGEQIILQEYGLKIIVRKLEGYRIRLLEIKKAE